MKLLDFGVVRGPEKQKSIPGVFKGKYGYCAPEQIEGSRSIAAPTSSAWGSRCGSA